MEGITNKKKTKIIVEGMFINHMTMTCMNHIPSQGNTIFFFQITNIPLHKDVGESQLKDQLVNIYNKDHTPGELIWKMIFTTI